MRQIVFVGLFAAALLHALHSTATATCPRNGGTLCNVSGDVSNVTAVMYPVYLEVDTYAYATFAWVDQRNAATSGSDIYTLSRIVTCVDSASSTGTATIAGSGDQTSPVIGVTGDLSPVPRTHLPTDNWGIILTFQDESGPDANIYARRFGATPPQTAWDAAAIPICNASGDQTSPVFLASGRGGGLFAWVDRRSLTSDIYAQVTDSAGIALWTPNGVPVCSAPGDQELLLAAPDGAGGGYFCWLDHRSGDALYAIRWTRDGLPASGWNVDGNILSSGVQLLGTPRVVADGSGMTVAWTDVRSDPQGDVMMQRLAPDGSRPAGWPVDGSVVAAGSGAQRMDDLVIAGAGNYYVVWEDERLNSGGNSDLFALRLDAGGATLPGWPAPACVDPARQEHARAMMLGSVLCVVFADDRNADRDLYASGLNPDGTLAPGWVLNGTVVSHAPDVQDDPALFAPFATWIDYRDRATNGSDLYAATIKADGRVDVTGPELPARFTLSAPRPNPSRRASSFTLDLSRTAPTNVAVFDCAGRRVTSLVTGTLEAGSHELRWDGRTAGGTAAAAGVYFVRARVAEVSVQRPIVLTR